MNLEIFTRQLRLMELLTQNSSLSVQLLAEKVGVHPRTVYRYIEGFQAAGFRVERDGQIYRLNHSSPFFRKISGQIHLTDAEAITVRQLLDKVSDHSPQMRSLREKLERLYDPHVLAEHHIDEKVAENLSQLYRAVSERRICVLRNYTSNNSRNSRDRIVEPYMFLQGNTDVRCFELESRMNKTFKVSRAERVEVLDLLWSNEELHEEIFIDLFHFSGTERHRVRLLLGQRSANLLQEEFSPPPEQLKRREDGRYLFDTQVCSFLGIGRFVLGLFDDIEIFRSPEFESYIRERVSEYAGQISK